MNRLAILTLASLMLVPVPAFACGGCGSNGMTMIGFWAMAIALVFAAPGVIVIIAKRKTWVVERWFPESILHWFIAGLGLVVAGISAMAVPRDVVPLVVVIPLTLQVAHLSWLSRLRNLPAAAE